MSMHRIFLSPKGFQQINESINFPIEEAFHQNYNWSERYGLDSSLSGGAISITRYCNISTQEFGVFNQTSKINTECYIELKISGSASWFTGVSSNRENNKSIKKALEMS